MKIEKYEVPQISSEELSLHVRMLSRSITKKTRAQIEYYTIRANEGYLYAMLRLGVLYFTAPAKLQNHRLAAEYFIMAAEGGWKGAMFKVAELYANGWGVTKDQTASEAWLKKAGETEEPSPRSFLADPSIISRVAPFLASPPDSFFTSGVFREIEEECVQAIEAIRNHNWE